MNDEATGRADHDENTTDFGFTRVDREAKAGMVRGVFDSVASRYDLMNDLMSGGIHRLWKRFTIELSGARPGQTILDIAGGTGDLAARFSRLVGPEGQVILADINAAMLEVGRDRLIDKGATGNIEVVQTDAQALPFEDNSVDCITIAFGLRNVTDKDMALRSMLRVLRPGGHVAFEVGEVRHGRVRLEEEALPCGAAAGFEPLLVLINRQNFTKTARVWGVENGRKGTNTNRVVLLRKPT